MKLREGKFKVQHPERETPFMLSVVNIYGVWAVRGYEMDAKPPNKPSHYLIQGLVREWLDRLTEFGGGVESRHVQSAGERESIAQ